MTEAPYKKDLDTLLADAQLAWRAPSVVAAVVRDGEVTWSGAVGSAVVGGLAAGPDVQYRLGSITKTFTAVLVHQLRDEGVLDLDDPLDRWIPDSRHAGVTLRRLLAHASGLQRELGDMWATLEVPDRDDLLAGFEAAQQVLPTQTSHHYSNLAYAILGEVVGRATSSTWSQQLEHRLLRPLGMSRTTLQPVGPRAIGYLSEPFADAVRPEPDSDLGSTAPAGQLWSTANDLVRWAAFLADPNPDVLAVETLEGMRRPVVVFDPATWLLAWGGGLMLWRRDKRVHHGHGGAMPGFLAGCYAYRDDLERAGAVVLTNTGRAADAEGLAGELLNAALDADPRRKPAWAASDIPAELRELLGPWWSEGSEFLVEWREGELTMIGRGGAEWRRTRFEAAGPDEWRAAHGREAGERLRVVRTDAAVQRLMFAGYAFTREPKTFTEVASS
ncbi:MAG: beta-lactamase [Frankiales bacterium]|nr:beta-lactamase [Frankiales bacterium]